MQKPKGMSRKEFHQCRKLNREWNPNTILVIYEENDYQFCGSFFSTPTDEGFRSVSLTLKPQKDGTVEVEQYIAQRDCDGRLDDNGVYIIRPSSGGKKRHYPHKGYYDMGRGKPELVFGQCEQYNRFRIARSVYEGHRDYSAEAMGY